MKCAVHHTQKSYSLRGFVSRADDLDGSFLGRRFVLSSIVFSLTLAVVERIGNVGSVGFVEDITEAFDEIREHSHRQYVKEVSRLVATHGTTQVLNHIDSHRIEEYHQCPKTENSDED